MASWNVWSLGRWTGAGAVLVLAGCSSVPLPPDGGAPISTSTSASPATASPSARADVPALPAAGSGRGAYYKDDGPGDNPPVGLAETPDAEPRIEPYTIRGNRPYVVFGKNYTPFTDERPYKERGRGSWYGKKFHGQTTSSGEPYDMYKMTAAHPTLPLPSYVRVTNVENGRQVIVRVNDRGPFHAGRIIDLSYTAALKLGYLANGSAMLEVERLLPDEIRRMAAQRKEQPALAATSGGTPEVEPGTGAEVAGVSQEGLPERVALVDSQPMLLPAAVSAASSPTAPAAAAPVAVTPAGFYLQLGAFGQAANAEAARVRLAQSGVSALQVVEQGSLHRVFSGPYATRAEAEAAARQLQRDAVQAPMIVQR